MRIYKDNAIRLTCIYIIQKWLKKLGQNLKATGRMRDLLLKPALSALLWTPVIIPIATLAWIYCIALGMGAGIDPELIAAILLGISVLVFPAAIIFAMSNATRDTNRSSQLPHDNSSRLAGVSQRSFFWLVLSWIAFASGLLAMQLIRWGLFSV